MCCMRCVQSKFPEVNQSKTTKSKFSKRIPIHKLDYVVRVCHQSPFVMKLDSDSVNGCWAVMDAAKSPSYSFDASVSYHVTDECLVSAFFHLLICMILQYKLKTS